MAAMAGVSLRRDELSPNLSASRGNQMSDILFLAIVIFCNDRAGCMKQMQQCVLPAYDAKRVSQATKIVHDCTVKLEKP